MKILHLDSTHPYLSNELNKLGFDNFFDFKSSKKEIENKLFIYHGIIIRSRIPIDKVLIDKATNLKFIARVGSGIENIDIKHAKKNNIKIISSPEGNSNAVGEHALGMLLSLINNISYSHNEIINGKWSREANRGYELKNKTVGLIGYGHTGKSFAKKLSGFDVSTIFFDLKSNLKNEFASEVTLKEIKETADVISIHSSLTKESYEILNTKFINECKKWIKEYYGENPETSDSYGRIVTSKHFNRLKAHLDDAKSKHATINSGANSNEDVKYIAPTIVSDLGNDALLLEDEIFGPILPIVTYKTVNEAIAYINTKERPLALYIYSKSKKNTKQFLNNTKAGGTCINNNIIHYANHNLPFGGVNNSGIGKSHGYHGFKAFSNERAVVKQHTFGISELLFPPYTGFKEKLARLTVKWF